MGMLRVREWLPCRTATSRASARGSPFGTSSATRARPSLSVVAWMLGGGGAPSSCSGLTRFQRRACERHGMRDRREAVRLRGQLEDASRRHVGRDVDEDVETARGGIGRQRLGVSAEQDAQRRCEEEKKGRPRGPLHGRATGERARGSPGHRARLCIHPGRRVRASRNSARLLPESPAQVFANTAHGPHSCAHDPRTTKNVSPSTNVRD